MGVVVCSRCCKYIDLDWHSDDVIYREKQNDFICFDCTEEHEICPECSEYRPNGCNCTQEVLP